MAQVQSSPGVPNSASLAAVTYSSATPILVGPTALVGTATITTLASITTETTNIQPQVLVTQANISPAHSSTPIILGPAVFKGAPFNGGPI